VTRWREAPCDGERVTSLATRLWRFSRLLAHIVQVLCAARWVLPRLERVERQRRLQQWAARLLSILQVHVIVKGQLPDPGQPSLLVANHISWLDIQALGVLNGARFVAKSEVRGWPLVGKIAECSGTFFIKRGCYRDAWRAKQRVATALRQGNPVAVFPEATTTDGRSVQKFYPAFLQAAIDAGVPVHPVTLRYDTANLTGNAAAAFIGDMTFAQSLVRILREPFLVVEMRLGPALSPQRASRGELAARAQQIVHGALVFSPPVPRIAVDRAAGASRFPAAPGIGAGGWPSALSPIG